MRYSDGSETGGGGSVSCKSERSTAGSRRISSRALRQAAWMIHEMDRSCLIASLWVSASIGALKYRVTFFLVDVDGTARPSFGVSDKIEILYGEIPAVEGRNTVRPKLTSRWEVQVRSSLFANVSPFTSRPAGLSLIRRSRNSKLRAKKLLKKLW